MAQSNPRSDPRTDRIAVAVGAILFTALALSFGDALIKKLSGGFGLWQIFLLRSCLVIPVLVLFGVAAYGRKAVLLKRSGWVALRSVMLVAMWVSFYAALPFLSLSVAAAAYYTSPIFIVLFSALFTGDRIGRTGVAAVAIGFCGIVLILRPDAADFNAFALLPLVSAALYALAMVVTRTTCRDETPIALSLALNIGFVLTGGAGLLFVAQTGGFSAQTFLTAPWIAMAAQEWLTMAVLATSVLIGSVGAAFAYQNAPPAIVGTFDFAYVGFAVIWGLVFFAERPDAISWVGIGMIVVSGMLSVRR